MSGKERLIVCVALGFGVGRIPFAPGTFGSVLGIGWGLLLLGFDSPAVFWVGTIGGILLSVWVGDQAEKILGQKDPSSIVIDEISALPICCLAAEMQMRAFQGGQEVAMFSLGWWVAIGLAFVLFRIFDIGKPFPVGRSQGLPGGWGLTVDDVLAALYAAGAQILIYQIWMAVGRG